MASCTDIHLSFLPHRVALRRELATAATGSSMVGCESLAHETLVGQRQDTPYL
jgi:hypothetical protein